MCCSFWSDFFLVNKRAQIKNIFIVGRRLRILPSCHQTPTLTGSNRSLALWIEPVRSSLSPSITAGTHLHTRIYTHAKALPQCIFSVCVSPSRSTTMGRYRTTCCGRFNGFSKWMLLVLMGSLLLWHPWTETMKTRKVSVAQCSGKSKAWSSGEPFKNHNHGQKSKCCYGQQSISIFNTIR